VKFDAIVAGMPDGLLVLDSDLRAIGWNQHFAAFVGVPEAILRVGLHIAEILRAQAEAGEFGSVDVEAEVARRIALIETWKPGGTVERRRPNGRVMELRRSPMADGGFVTLYTDVTARHQAEAQLRQAQKMEAIGHLAGGMAHDFNNLLMVIEGNLDLASQALARSDLVGADRKIRTAHEGSERAANLTRRLLAFARRQELAPKIANVNRVVSGIADLIRHSIGASVHFETVLGGGTWDVSIDIHQLENALLNLAINAKDAMPGGGKLTIETANTSLDAQYPAYNTDVIAGQYVLIAVSDSGTGMTPEQVDRAFEPFFTTKGATNGSGLGLAQVFGFIKQSDGYVRIYTNLGAGTTVKLYLPRYEETVKPTFIETQPSDIEIPRGQETETILVVEDDEDVLAYTVNALETLGYHVIAAHEAHAAMLAVEAHPNIKLMLTDVELPGLNGQQLAEAVALRRPDIAVAYTTGYTANAIIHQQIFDNRARTLNKPYALIDLAKYIRHTLDQSGMVSPES
jgi:signal transduction histidine kinase/CheY-like chemotaxis protein